MTRRRASVSLWVSLRLVIVLPGMAGCTTRVLNGLAPGDRLTPGQHVKIIVE